MRIVNENYHTRSLRYTTEDGRRIEVEFDGQGRAEVPDEDGAIMVDLWDTVREADGPDDVSRRWEEDHRTSLADVDFASDRARELAEEAGLEASSFDGRAASGETGFTADDVRAIAGDGEESG